jgi:hypothetical protein
MSNTTKAGRVHAMVNDGGYPGMSKAFDAHMGASCWVDQAYRPDASTWAAAWKAAVAAERERWTNAVSNAERDRNDATQVRDAALAALFEVERLAGHDDALTEWREKWAHLWALREGPNLNSPAETAE